MTNQKFPTATSIRNWKCYILLSYYYPRCIANWNYFIPKRRTYQLFIDSYLDLQLITCLSHKLDKLGNDFRLIHLLLFRLKQFEKRKCKIWIIYIEFYYLPDQLFIYFRIINFFRAITFCLATEIDGAKQFLFSFSFFLKK